MLKTTLVVTALTSGLLLAGDVAMAQITVTPEHDAQELPLTYEWDKIFPMSENVEHQKVLFKNRYNITLAADLYIPKNKTDNIKFPAIIIAGPFGAVKEQVSGLYAQTMAERGFITLAFDPSWTGESGGMPRNIASPEVNTDDFSAAVDFLILQRFVDPDRIGILGICGWGGIALNAAAIDTRIKATVTSTMYDMSRLFTYGYNDSITPEQRYKAKVEINNQRTENVKRGTQQIFSPLPDTVLDDQPQFLQDYVNFYKTERGYHPRSVGSNEKWVNTMPLAFMNMPLLSFAHEIRTPVLLIHGEKAHSRYFSEDAFRKLTTKEKEIYIVSGANHTDLYDNSSGKIPFDKIESFLKKYLIRTDG